MTPLPRFTPGRFTALWVVLRSVKHLGEGVTADELVTFSRRSGLRAGGLPISDGFVLATHGDFLRIEDGRVRLTSLGRQALTLVDEEEPSIEVLRLFSSVLFLRHPPAWVAYWQGNPANADLAMPDGSREILRAAALLEPMQVNDVEAWALWNALKVAPPLEVAMAQRAAIGAAGEELALERERDRLRKEGFPDLASRVRWVARESATYGFDLLSYSGASVVPDQPTTPLAIEVKATAIVATATVGFYLTRHEWQTARRFPGRYLLQHWSGVRPGSPPTAVGLIQNVRPEQLERHLPQAVGCDGQCAWESTWLEIPRAELAAAL